MFPFLGEIELAPGLIGDAVKIQHIRGKINYLL